MTPTPAHPVPLLPDRRRAAAALGLAVFVLLLHALLLGGLPVGAGAARSVNDADRLRDLRGTRGLQVRQITRAAPVPATPAGSVSDALAATAPPLGTRAAPRRQPARTPQTTVVSESAAANNSAGPEAATAGAGEAADIGASEADTAPVALAAGTLLPTYATRLPPPFTLQYAMQREGPGRQGVQAQLRWRPVDGGYTLAMGLGAVGWASVGALDLHGVAPERHVETRRGRELRAANFQRAPAGNGVGNAVDNGAGGGAGGGTGGGAGGGRITFSGPPLDHPLWPGVQDRLSWMVQLPAVLEAEPALGQVGSSVTLMVVGVRGDAALWTFTVVSRGPVELPAGVVADAVQLLREPQRLFDTRVEVWLDAARHHLPVRFRLRNRAEGPVTDFLLTELSRP